MIFKLLSNNKKNKIQSTAVKTKNHGKDIIKEVVVTLLLVVLKALRWLLVDPFSWTDVSAKSWICWRYGLAES